MKKKILYIIIPVIISLLVFLGVYIYFNHEDKVTSLTISDKKWIENNNSVKINLDIINDIPVLGYSGEGVLFDFVKDFELTTNLSFSKNPYLKNSTPTTNELKFRILSPDTLMTNKDLLLLEDGYVLLSKINVRYDNVSQISDKKLATLENALGELTYYTKNSNRITYKSYSDVESLLTALSNNEIDMIAIPQIMYLEKIINLNDIYINYYFTEMTNKIVLTLLDNDSKLNTIVKKYFEKWKDNNYVTSYNKQYLKYYVNSKELTDKQTTTMLNKNYTYGYVENPPYQTKIDGKVLGIAGEYLERIKRLTGIEITYKQYKNREQLLQAAINKEIDIYFDDLGLIASGWKGTISPFVEKYVILSKVENKKVVNTFESLKNQTVNTLNTNLIYNYFRDNSKANLVIKSSIDKLKGNDLIALDKEIYNYYRNNIFAGYEVLFEDYITNDYRFYISDNLTDFYNLFNYIIGTNSYYNYRNEGLASINVNIVERSSFEELYLIVLGLVLLPVLIGFAIYLFLKRNKKVKEIKKEDRKKYTDMLTSLKNRNYLNLHMEEWSNCKVYPQSVIIVDLNNVKYVNDNYGHEEGDRLIAKAASILVNTQLENSEIIRTDGNEFLIYLIGYSEKQTEIYAKKLTKEFKNLNYGFGATVGYSVISDDIKTLDDAINEATIDMRNKKEDLK